MLQYISNYNEIYESLQWTTTTYNKLTINTQFMAFPIQNMSCFFKEFLDISLDEKNVSWW